MLSQQQLEVSQAQWSDVSGDYTMVLATEAVTGPITNSIVLGSAHWRSILAISLMLGLGNATN